jgi:hypothetical protein
VVSDDRGGGDEHLYWGGGGTTSGDLHERKGGESDSAASSRWRGDAGKGGGTAPLPTRHRRLRTGRGFGQVAAWDRCPQALRTGARSARAVMPTHVVIGSVAHNGQSGCDTGRHSG